MNKPTIDHPAFPKVPRLNRECVITEKIDGTNGLIHIDECGDIYAGSRNRWITPEDDNYGFARWVDGNKEQLLRLGPGTHYGEWWGAGIQRKYGVPDKRFSLFNVNRWRSEGNGIVEIKTGTVVEGLGVVPTLYTGAFTTGNVEATLRDLVSGGSVAAPGFMDPEGIIVFHCALQKIFKVTCKNDESPKSHVDKP